MIYGKFFGFQKFWELLPKEINWIIWVHIFISNPLTLSIYIDEYMALCLVLMISSFGLCLVWTHAEFWRFEQPTKIDGTLFFLVLEDWGRKDAFKVALQVLPTSLFFFNLYYVFVCLCACRMEVEEKDATCNWHFHLL